VTRVRGKSGGKAHRYAATLHIVMESEDYRSLSGNASKLLNWVVYQYNGKNNGDLNCAYGFMSKCGFKSKETLNRAKKELLAKQLITETRAGRFQNPGGICSLYALTWLPIDDCNGKIEVSPTRAPPRKFSLEGKTARVISPH